MSLTDLGALRGVLLKGGLCAALLPASAAEWPGQHWITASPAEVGMRAEDLEQARNYALTGGGSGYITRHGKLVLRWGDPAKRYDLKSTTKSFGAAALGLALKDGKLRLEDRARNFHPTLGTPPESNALTGWLGEITIFHLASQTAGFEKPGGFTRLLFRPGSQWDYSDSGPNWLAECITLLYRRDLNDWMFERLFVPIGIKNSDLAWRRNSYRPHLLDGIARREFGSGISANVDAMVRFGYLFLRRGQWNGRELLPADFIERMRGPLAEVRDLPNHNPNDHHDAPQHYGLLWWNNGDGTIDGLPRDAYWSWGLYDSLIVVIPSLDIVVSRAGQSWKREKGARHYDVLKPFLTPVAASVQATAFPPGSAVIKDIQWAAPNTIIRHAQGSDNWPMTWADDDALYTAYGDGWGFEPRVPHKLSLGIAQVTGTPPEIKGVNVRAPSVEHRGDGARGRKASGMLMVEGVLYMWLRNATNSQLFFSSDHGLNWTPAPWKWTESFGCPTFLNFGPNYEGARDEFVYVYSPDADDAYTVVDRMVLARVLKTRLRERHSYEFFKSLEASGQPEWTPLLRHRGAVLVVPGQCYRAGVTYNAALKRYLWCVTLPLAESEPKSYGLAIYDAPEPWGPWTTAYRAQHWDVDAGETASFPTKWMSPAGKQLWLVFAGDDSFAVRRATLILRQE